MKSGKNTVSINKSFHQTSFPVMLCSLKNLLFYYDFIMTLLYYYYDVMTHNSSPWFESISDELFIAKRERRQAERKWRNTKLTIFKDLYRQAKHKVSKLVHTIKCKFFTERVALASSSK